jgi:excisionase family DNA binding protein
MRRDTDLFKRLAINLKSKRTRCGSPYLSIDEAAKIARLHHTTLRDWIKDGSLKAFRAGRVYRIRRSDLDERLTAKAADPIAIRIEDRVNAIVAKRTGRAA